MAAGDVFELFVPVPTWDPGAPPRKTRAGKWTKAVPAGHLTPSVVKLLWLSSNLEHKSHPVATAKVKRAWRAAAARRHEQYMPMVRLQRARITAEFIKPRGGRYDPGNLYPVAKACIDGLVQAGLLPDDDHLHLVGPDPRHGAPDKVRPGVRFIIEDLGPMPRPAKGSTTP